jgi:hypothetical protein
MILALGDRWWYFVYQDEKEQFNMSWPVTGGKSRFSCDIATSVRQLRKVGGAEC